MKRIALAGVGGVALVDDEDFEFLSRWLWSAVVCGGGKVYARRSERHGGKHGRKYYFLMHRELLGLGPLRENPEVVDHINARTLDNRRANLRVTTQNGNQRNKRKTRGSSQFKGITWMKAMSLWQVRITVNNRKLFVGYSANEEVAARMYDDAARFHFREFASVNFPRPGEVGCRAA